MCVCVCLLFHYSYFEIIVCLESSWQKNSAFSALSSIYFLFGIAYSVAIVKIHILTHYDKINWMAHSKICLCIFSPSLFLRTPFRNELIKNEETAYGSYMHPVFCFYTTCSVSQRSDHRPRLVNELVKCSFALWNWGTFVCSRSYLCWSIFWNRFDAMASGLLSATVGCRCSLKNVCA